METRRLRRRAPILLAQALGPRAAHMPKRTQGRRCSANPDIQSKRTMAQLALGVWTACWWRALCQLAVDTSTNSRPRPGSCSVVAGKPVVSCTVDDDGGGGGLNM